MQDKILSWLNRLEERTDLQLLIPQYETVVTIGDEHEQVCLILAKDKCKKTEEFSTEPHLLVQGNPQSIQKLLSGREMLQNLFKHKEISVKGTYRTILLFESLCWLNKA